jgi:tetratricopeptide (TPR) repeat protein
VIRKIIFVLLLFFPQSGAAREIPPDSLFLRGNEAYRRGEYGEAVRCYEEARSQGWTGSELLYNLGNAYYKDGQIGRAVASYERALRLAPRDGDIRANLEFARGRTLDKEMVPTRFPLLRLLLGLAGRLTTGEWVTVSEAFYVSLLVLLFLRVARPRLAPRLRAPLQATALLLVVSLALLGTALHDRTRTRAVVLASELAVRSGPGERFTEEFLLHEGSVLHVHRESEGWILVGVSPDLRGWVPEKSVERVEGNSAKWSSGSQVSR